MNTRKSRGFALPTVLMASIIMLMVLVAAVTSTVAVRTSLRTQYYNQLSQQASEAGVVYAKECIKASGGTPGWTDAKPLKPGTNCSGDPIAAGLDCAATPKDARCSVMVVDSNTIISFSVARPLQDSNGAFNNIQSTGGVNLLRSSDSTVWRQYFKSAKSTVVDKSFMNDFHWKEISAGYYHTCGIASDDKAYCWGLNDEGQLGNGTTVSINSPVAVDTTDKLANLKIKSIRAAYEHTCALASDNNVYCWGAQTYGRLGNGISTDRSTVPVKVTNTGYLNGLYVKSLSTSTGSYSTCVIASDNNAYCWGANWDGEIGDGTTSQRNTPWPVLKSGALNNQAVKSISVGGGSTCVIANDNNLYCWGAGDEGQMGAGTNNHINSSPIKSSFGALTVKSISVGEYSACAVASDDNAYCWGYNTNGGIGDGTDVDKNVPTPVDTSANMNGLKIKQVSVGGSHSCAIASDNNAYCWGRNGTGQLGYVNGRENSYVPVPVDRSGVFKGVTINNLTLGKFHTCAVASDDKGYCWGYDDYGQISTSIWLMSESPVPIRAIRNNELLLNGLGIVSITSGSHHVCAIASDAKTYCWGINEDGQLGSYLFSHSSPIPLALYSNGALGGSSLKSVSAGHDFTCGISAEDRLFCWGENSHGQLGNNSIVNSSTPVAVVDKGLLKDKDIKSVVAGDYHACVVTSDDNAYCWGKNAAGQLGNATYGDDSRVPVLVANSGVLSGKHVKSLASGDNHVCAVASDDKAYCWGYNNKGQIGDGTTSNRSEPTTVGGGLSIKSLAAGESHTCAIAFDNNVYCWGDNDHGQLGDGTTDQRTTPVAVSKSGVLGSLTAKSISAKGDLTCAIASDDNAYCWGDNELGGLGDGTEADYSTVPVSVVKNGVLNNQTVKSIINGPYHACVIALDNKIYCWGTNSYGEHGNSVYRRTNAPDSVLYNITNPPAQSRVDFGSVYY